MLYDIESMNNLIAIYKNQISSTLIASSADKFPESFPESDHSDRFDKGDHEGSTKCEYSCCNDKGCCSSPLWYACLGGAAISCCTCCCYVTNGFNGAWIYWPF